MKKEISSASKEKVIADLKRVAKELGKSPTWIQFDNLGEVPLSSVTKNFGTLNKALIAAELPINRKGTRSKTDKPRKYKSTTRHRTNKGIGHRPIKITSRICNVCSRPFQAEDDMRSCPICATTKRSADNRGGLSDTAHGIGYLT